MTAAAVINIASRVPKRGLIVGCFSRPDPHHDVVELLQIPWMHNGEVSWLHFGSGTFAAELTTIGRERGVLVANSLESNY